MNMFCPNLLSRREALKRGFSFYALSAVAMAFHFATYMLGSSIFELMDTGGWLFFLSSCVSHAAIVCLLPFAFYAVLVGMRCPKAAAVVQVALAALLFILNYLNEQVYGIYRFHINGFVLNMVFGPGAGEIFTFSTLLYIYEALFFLLFVFLTLVVYRLSVWIWRHKRKVYVWRVSAVFVMATLLAHGIHVYGSFVQQPSVMKSAALLPYYFPTTAYSLMTRLGVHPPADRAGLAEGGSGDVCYPVKPLQAHRPENLPNIVLILIDSWSKRALTPDCMPAIARFAKENQWFANHVSGSNGTRSGVFSLFFGLSCYYWESFEASHAKPLLVRRLLDLGYDFQTYPSAPLTNPDFARVLFSGVKGLRTGTPGRTSLERDEQITKDFMAYLDDRKDSRKPFFSFLFYDLPHSFELPEGRNIPFSPAWAFADYTKLGNSMDATPFFNLYRNCCYNDDRLIAQVLETLERNRMMDNTIVIITGDHAQEFNENHRNYWGHNGNFSQWQIAVPLICHFPGRPVGRFTHRTTHYDVVPTLMKDYLGVRNELSDYSMGHLLTDTQTRNWHVVGSNLNYAFIVQGDTILEKNAAGGLDVYAPDMQPLPGYRVDVKQFNKAVKQLNHFYK